ncbi:MAG TPA: hypothetical protein VE631_03635, partial [Alphaproteobacteria bacterium]|nr:hypothetical protein [Alphaproteobacteria bacterium]
MSLANAAKEQARQAPRWIWLLALLLLLYPVIVTAPYYQQVGALVLLSAIAASSWNLIGGYAGQVSVGH